MRSIFQTFNKNLHNFIPYNLQICIPNGPITESYSKLTNRSTKKDANKANFLYHVMDQNLSSVKNALQNHKTEISI